MKNVSVQQAKKPSSPVKTVLRIALPLLVVAALWVVFMNRQGIETMWRAWQFKPTAEMSGLMADLDLTKRGDTILRASDPQVEGRENFNQSCPNGDLDVYVLGCYYDGKVVVFDVDSGELEGIKQVTLAHELLHAVYEKHLSKGEQEKLHPYLEQIYAGNEELQERISHYGEDKKYGELHSIVGSEMSGLDAVLAEHYAKYFADQPAIAGRYAGYSGTMKRLREQSEELLGRIDGLEAEVEQMKVDYESDWGDLTERIDDFNYRADNGYFASQAAFNAERAGLVAESSRLDGVWNSINDKIDEYNGLIVEYNSIATHINQLSSDMNSNFAPPPEDI